MKPFAILFPRTSEGATLRAHYHSLLENFHVSITDFAVFKALDDWLVLILGAGTSQTEIQAIANALKSVADVQPSWPFEQLQSGEGRGRGGNACRSWFALKLTIC